MNKLLTLALSLPMLACVVGSGTEPGDNTPGGGGGGGGGGTADKADHITTDTTWSGTMNVTKTVTVDHGATLTIAAGTTVTLAPETSIDAAGIVDVQGTKASPVHLSPATTGGFHNGISIPANGELKMAYGVQVGGGISVNGGKITVTDTAMSQAAGDFLVVAAGTVDISYSAIGLEAGTLKDTTHCDMHFGGSGTTIKVTHSNVSSSSYGIMLYGGSGVDLTFNNWFNNSQADVDTSGASGIVSGDISNGWFEKPLKAFPGASITAANLSLTRLPTSGPR